MAHSGRNPTWWGLLCIVTISLSGIAGHWAAEAKESLRIEPSTLALCITNMTTNFSSNMPVTWSLVTKTGDASTLIDSGYGVDETELGIMLTAGSVPGVFMLTGTALECDGDATCPSKSIYWVVLSGVQATLLGLFGATVLFLGVIFCLACMKPVDPNDRMLFGGKKDIPMAPQYGSFQPPSPSKGPGKVPPQAFAAAGGPGKSHPGRGRGPGVHNL